MDGFCLTTGINTLAVTLAQTLTDDELALAAAFLTQLGDTLATIAVVRAQCEAKKNGPG
ncbi:hypothetical protein KQI82_07975 [Oscillibacter sp. MSJ-2]|uniref:DUF6774 domain-containing protein n=1 Tax=Dysosmobacter acutus TaxID=2841504 RepID=A0ABS6F991_9FIRM|nr:DUF6774 domain-containing protein [Dysosmobacter acutus]MBU5626851.1 hypothetical protein [Dysosmobacter acutus]